MSLWRQQFHFSTSLVHYLFKQNHDPQVFQQADRASLLAFYHLHSGQIVLKFENK